MLQHKNQAESELSLTLHFCRLQASSRLHKAPPTPGREVCFTQSISGNPSLIQKHLPRCTQNNV